MTLVLSSQQDEAVKSFANWFKDIARTTHVIGEDQTPQAPFFYMAGYAGSGKTTILPAMIDNAGLVPEKVHFCAPTGKAAKIMSEKLKAFGIEKTAKTIHSSIYRPRALKAEVLEGQVENTRTLIESLEKNATWSISPTDGRPKSEHLMEAQRTLKLLQSDLDKAYDENEGPKFSLNTESEVRNSSLIVVDEASMVGSVVGKDLRSFGVPILVIGDPGQLPPVQDTPAFTDGDPDFFLSEIHRQAKESPIIQLSILARNGKPLRVGNYGDGVEVVSRSKDNATYDLARDAQLIVGTHFKRFLITRKLRKALDYKSTGPMKGEPLIICKNSRNNPAFINGTFMTCAEDANDFEEGSAYFKIKLLDEFGQEHTTWALQALFEEHTLGRNEFSGTKSDVFRAKREREHIDFGWVITCHKSQGSQWDDVILHDEGAVFRDDAAKWTYTGITRAARRLSVIV